MRAGLAVRGGVRGSVGAGGGRRGEARRALDGGNNMVRGALRKKRDEAETALVSEPTATYGTAR